MTNHDPDALRDFLRAQEDATRDENTPPWRRFHALGEAVWRKRKAIIACIKSTVENKSRPAGN